MTRTMLLTAFTLALLGCVAESQGDSPTTATGDANAAIIECACPAETLEWTSKGGSGVNYVTKVAACAKATLTRSYPDAQNNPVVQSCEDEVASCGAAGLVTTADLAKALGQPDVKLAFAEAQKLGEPARFGLFAPDVWDFPDLEVTVDGATVMFGYPCGGQQGCKDPPAGLATLSTILNMIDHAMRSEATCDAKLGTDPTIGVK